jgi:adenosylmethionine-8-amino-7-oxononanoate aminotransferase
VAHGYQHPHLVEAITKQAEALSHIMLGGLAHEQTLRLASRLAAITPDDLNHVFFSDSGSTAVEVAMKMALQYWRNVGKPNKNRFVCFTHGYHGDTLGVMSISDPERGMHKAFKRNVTPQFVMDIPTDEYSLAEFETILSGIQKECAAMVIEPLVQGAGGFKFHSADMLAALAGLAKKYDMLFIADEIATGFCRTGSMFACNEAGITPDIMCLGKALTGGMVGLGTTIARTHVFDAFLSDDADKALMHGPTFMGNPIACAAANASLDLFEREPRLAQANAIETWLQQGLAPCAGLPAVRDVRVKGAIGVVELHPEFANPRTMREAFVERGCWIRPFDNVVYLWPPLVISEAEVQRLCEAILDVGAVKLK